MSEGRVLIYGGRGALGATCVSYFKNKQWVSGKQNLGIAIKFLKKR